VSSKFYGYVSDNGILPAVGILFVFLFFAGILYLVNTGKMNTPVPAWQTSTNPYMTQSRCKELNGYWYGIFGADSKWHNACHIDGDY